MTAAGTSWWPLTKKVRVAVAGVILADAAQLAAWVSDDVTGKVAVATIILATAGAVGAYLTSDDSSPP